MADEVMDVAPDISAEPSAATPPPAEPQPSAEAPVDRREVIRAAMNGEKPTNRGKHAQFQPRNTGKFSGPPKFPTPEPPQMPKSLKRELQEHWEMTPLELRQAVHQREVDFEKGISQYKTQAQQAAEILDEFKPYEWILRNENTTPKAAISELLKTAAILRTGTPAQKAQAAAFTMQQYGVPLDAVQALMGGVPSPVNQPQSLNPQYNQLAQQVQQLTQYITTTQQQQQQALENRAMSVIEQFASDPNNQHFDAVQDRMLTLLQTPGILGNLDNMTEREKLQVAYDTAVRLDPVLSAQVLAQQQAKIQARQQVNNAKSAAVMVNGAPGASFNAAVQPNDRRAVIANAIRSLRT